MTSTSSSLRLADSSNELRAFLEKQAQTLRHEAMLDEHEVGRLDGEIERYSRMKLARQRTATEKRTRAAEIEERVQRLREGGR